MMKTRMLVAAALWTATVGVASAELRIGDPMPGFFAPSNRLSQVTAATFSGHAMLLSIVDRDDPHAFLLAQQEARDLSARPELQTVNHVFVLTGSGMSSNDAVTFANAAGLRSAWVLVDDGTMARDFSGTVRPETYAFDSRGIVVGAKQGSAIDVLIDRLSQLQHSGVTGITWWKIKELFRR